NLLARGLALDPEARHASLEALVDALAAELHPRSRKVFVAFSLASIVAAAAWVARDRTPAPCTGATEALATTWNDGRATSVADALASSGRPWSRRVRDEVDRRLHAYADAWVVEHEAT